ncbi:MAG: inositol monophosphatase family protein, partial [Cyanobacteria bacterium J06648_11]
MSSQSSVDADLLRRLDVATEAATAAGTLLKTYCGKLVDVQEKRPGDLVTEADRASEELVLGIIERHFPEDAILAEESGALGNASSSYRWAID